MKQKVNDMRIETIKLFEADASIKASIILKYIIYNVIKFMNLKKLHQKLPNFSNSKTNISSKFGGHFYSNDHLRLL